MPRADSGLFQVRGECGATMRYGVGCAHRTRQRQTASAPYAGRRGRCGWPGGTYVVYHARRAVDDARQGSTTSPPSSRTLPTVLGRETSEPGDARNRQSHVPAPSRRTVSPGLTSRRELGFARGPTRTRRSTLLNFPFILRGPPAAVGSAKHARSRTPSGRVAAKFARRPSQNHGAIGALSYPPRSARKRPRRTRRAGARDFRLTFARRGRGEDVERRQT